MLFNSSEFLLAFLPITFFVYFYLNHHNAPTAGKSFLVLSSLFFYSWWDIAYLPIIASSMIVNFKLGVYLSDKKEPNPATNKRKTILIIGIISNLLVLAYFKYMDFFITNINYVFDSNISLLNLTLPLAISFFTFQQVAYLVDAYRKEVKEHNFLNYSVFVSFFPQLIAGPIVHHKEMMPQFESIGNRFINYRNVSLGLFIFSVGLFKKVAIADSFAVWANEGFDSEVELKFFEAWGASLSYTFQLYFDFSGYADMAIGLALMFNIALPINFNSPYKSTNIQDFWRRWHMTLSRFLKDYVYIPLGGNRKGESRIYLNLMATFVLGGIWHGASWTFIFWGALHGIAIVIHRAWSRLNIKLWSWLSWLITFNFVNFAWIFFRANNWEDATKVLKGMIDYKDIKLSPEAANFLNYMFDFSYFSLTGTKKDYYLNIVAFEYILIFGLLAFFLPNTMEISRNQFRANHSWSLICAILLTISIIKIFFGGVTSNEFLYFNF